MGQGLPLAVDGPQVGLADVVESDRLYFELGARTEPFANGTLAWIEGMTGMAAGAVAHLSGTGPLDPLPLAELEHRLRALAAPLGRIYLDRRCAVAEAALRKRGYRQRLEWAFAGTVEGKTDLEALAVNDSASWERKREFHAAVSDAPDGHRGGGAPWARLERIKWEAGGLQPFLIRKEGAIAGAFSILEVRGLARLKNLVIHPGWRRRGLALEVLRWASARAGARGERGLCMFAVAGDAGESLYRAAGLSCLGCQYEWTRPLE